MPVRVQTAQRLNADKWTQHCDMRHESCVSRRASTMMPKSPMTEVLQRAAAHARGLTAHEKPLIDSPFYTGRLLFFACICSESATPTTCTLTPNQTRVLTSCRKLSADSCSCFCFIYSSPPACNSSYNRCAGHTLTC
jgi:hypothetical protein